MFADTTTEDVFFRDASVLLQPLQRALTNSGVGIDRLTGAMDTLAV